MSAWSLALGSLTSQHACSSRIRHNLEGHRTACPDLAQIGVYPGGGGWVEGAAEVVRQGAAAVMMRGLAWISMVR